MASLRSRTRRYFVLMCAFMVVFLMVLSWKMWHSAEILRFTPVNRGNESTTDRAKSVKAALKVDTLPRQHKDDELNGKWRTSRQKAVDAISGNRLLQTTASTDNRDANSDAGDNAMRSKPHEREMNVVKNQHSDFQKGNLERNYVNQHEDTNTVNRRKLPALINKYRGNENEKEIGDLPPGVEDLKLKAKTDDAQVKKETDLSNVLVGVRRNKSSLPNRQSSVLQGRSRTDHSEQPKSQNRVQIPSSVVDIPRSENAQNQGQPLHRHQSQTRTNDLGDVRKSALETVAGVPKNLKPLHERQTLSKPGADSENEPKHPGDAEFKDERKQPSPVKPDAAKDFKPAAKTVIEQHLQDFVHQHVNSVLKEQEKVEIPHRQPVKEVFVPRDKLASNPQGKTFQSDRGGLSRRQGLNETVLHGVARHNELLKSLHAKMERLRQLPILQKNTNIQDALEAKWKASNAVPETKLSVKDNDEEEKGEKNGENLDENTDDYEKEKELDVNDDDSDDENDDDDKDAPENDDAETERATTRPNSCKECFPRDFPTLIDHERYCREMSYKPIVMIMIFTSADHTDQRNAIRETWGSKCQDPSSEYRCLFVLGRARDETTNKKISAESTRYQDILQFDFFDSYANLTYKTMASLHWLETNCPDVAFFMKTDDDMFVNTELIPVMLTAAPTTDFLGGFCWGHSSPNRDFQSKWYVPFQTYTRPKFPPMCSGTGYIMSHDVMTKVLAASQNVPFFHLEDVYISLCLQNYHVRPMRIQGFNNMFTQFSECGYRFSVMTSHEVSPNALRDYWRRMHSCKGRNPSGRELFVELPYPPTSR